MGRAVDRLLQLTSVKPHLRTLPNGKVVQVRGYTTKTIKHPDEFMNSSPTRPGPTGDFEADSRRVLALQNYYIANGRETSHVYASKTRPGSYTMSRELQHEQIIDSFLSRPGIKHDRKLLIVGGLPGAGKTTFINSELGQRTLGINLADYVTANPDEVKDEMVRHGMVPDYPGLTPNEAATLIHEESSDIMKQILMRAIAQGKNVAYDTSLSKVSQADRIFKTAQSMEPPPHEKTVLFIDVPLDVAKQRAKRRYETGGRFLPMSFIDNMASPDAQYRSINRREYEVVKRNVHRAVRVDSSGDVPFVAEDIRRDT